jgi:hypothetical protein
LSAAVDAPAPTVFLTPRLAANLVVQADGVLWQVFRLRITVDFFGDLPGMSAFCPRAGAPSQPLSTETVIFSGGPVDPVLLDRCALHRALALFALPPGANDAGARGSAPLVRPSSEGSEGTPTGSPASISATSKVLQPAPPYDATANEAKGPVPQLALALDANCTSAGRLPSRPAPHRVCAARDGHSVICAGAMADSTMNVRAKDAGAGNDRATGPGTTDAQSTSADSSIACHLPSRPAPHRACAARDGHSVVCAGAFTDGAGDARVKNEKFNDPLKLRALPKSAKAVIFTWPANRGKILFTFSLPDGCRLVVVNFAKLDPRRHKPWFFYNLVSCPRAGYDFSDRIGPVPFMLPTVLSVPPCPPPDDALPSDPSHPCFSEPTWSLDRVRAVATDYPYQDLVTYVINGLVFGFGVLLDDQRRLQDEPRDLEPPGRSVRNMPSLGPHLSVARSKLLDEVSRHFVSSPVESIASLPHVGCPKTIRPCPLGTVFKDKWQRTLDRRLVLDYSATFQGRPSINDRLFDVRLAMHYIQTSNFVNLITFLGPNTCAVTEDFRWAHRTLHVSRALWFCTVMQIPADSDMARMVIRDLRNNFGNAEASPSWQALVALVLWEARRRNIPWLFNNVDNLFSFVGPLPCGALDSVGLAHRVSTFHEVLSSFGPLTHEPQQGPRFKANGWNWDTTPEAFHRICFPKRLDLIRSLTGDAVLRMGLPKGDTFTLVELESLEGILYFIADAFPAGLAALSHLLHAIRDGNAVMRRKGLNRESTRVRLSASAKHSLSFWHREMLAWDGCCPLVARFGPCTSFKFLVRTDGSSLRGAGGYCASLEVSLAIPWPAWVSAGGQRLCASDSTFFELWSVCLFLRLFAHLLTGSTVQFEVDSRNTASILSKGYSSRAELVPLIDYSLRCTVRHHIVLRVVPINRTLNPTADHLSNLQIASARSSLLLEVGPNASLGSPVTLWPVGFRM